MTTPGWAVHLPRPAGDGAGASPVAPAPPGDTLPMAWAARFDAAPDRPVLWEERRGWIRAGDLDGASRRVAGRLAAAGLRPGDRILMSAATSVELVEAHVAALRLGLVVVPANTAYREREIAHVVADCSPRAAVVDDAERADWIRRAGPDVLVVGPDVDVAGGNVDGGRGGPGPRTAALDAAAPGDPALIGYTSGTTGTPKGAVLSHANLLASSESVRLAWRWTADDRLVLALPLFHIHGLGVGLHGTLLAGASAVLLPRFDPGAVLDAAAVHDATLFFGVPTMYARLADSPRLAELGRLRLCVSGSAPLPPAVFDRLAAGSGQRVLERYGMTETGMNVSNPYDGERRPGTVGFPLPGVELRLARARGTGGVAPTTAAGAATVGEIELRGPNVFGGYWGRPEETAAAFTADGWFRTGDIGQHDPDGYLRLVGRARELIITGGLNVYPREVEDVLREHPAVADVAVAGVPDAEWGEVVTAWIVPTRSGAPPPDAELLGFAAERLARFKCPRRVVVVDALPRNALGKVLRHELRPGGSD
ncbi:MAG: malonyl-CoA/methylmalonyl-CoA synthetase [Actinomycetota bacterium]|nr:malonyl-CoA/methylmalonyl-CoA synthetase [Actinomycetota bacterium]